MANPFDPLLNLKDIHLPSPISAWPWAIGWYIVAFGVVDALAFAIKTVKYRYQKKRPQQEALRLLSQIQKIYELEKDTAKTAALVSELLKRVAFSYYPRHEVAGLKGAQWIEFLTIKSQGLDFKTVESLLIQTPYQLNPNDDLTPLFELSRTWIKQRSHHV